MSLDCLFEKFVRSRSSNQLETGSKIIQSLIWITELLNKALIGREEDTV